MRTKYIIRTWLLLAAFTGSMQVIAQDSTAPEVPRLNVYLRYFIFNNRIPYVMVNTKTKVDGKFQPVKDIDVEVYLDSVAPSNLTGKVHTNKNGEGYTLVPQTLKTLWDGSALHKFYAVAAKTKQFDEATTDIEITKAKLVIDTTTVDSVKSITAKVMELKDNEWVPAVDVEMKIGVKRLGGALSVGKEATYTTDSTGTVTAEFTRDKLPAAKGMLTLVVNVEDNDKYGNLVLEQQLPWGVNMQQANDWGKRSLWSTRFRTPIWLLFMAYSIMGAVWGVLVYLIIQIFRLRKIGKVSGFEI